MHYLEFLIWLSLGVLGYLTLHAVIERLLFHSSTKVAQQSELDAFVRRLRETQSLGFVPKANERKRMFNIRCVHTSNLNSLGWLSSLLCLANGQVERLRELIYGFQQSASRFSGFLPTTVNVGSYLGLAGTILAFVLMAVQPQNLTQTIALAFQTTLAGLLISIPASVVSGLLEGRLDRLLDQSEQLLDALDEVEASGGGFVTRDTSDDGGNNGATAAAMTEFLDSQKQAAVQMGRIVRHLDEVVGAMHLASASTPRRSKSPDAMPAEPVGSIRNINGHRRNGSEWKGGSDGDEITA